MARVFAVIFMACCVSAVAQDGVPHTFTDGEVIDAQKFNENFAKLKTLEQLRGLVEVIENYCDYPLPQTLPMTINSCVASCPTDKVLTGGGCKAVEGTIKISEPTRTTYICKADYGGPLTAYAVCL